MLTGQLKQVLQAISFMVIIFAIFCLFYYSYSRIFKKCIQALK